jgi:hypothetical protein
MDLQLSSPIVLSVSGNGRLMMATSVDAVHPTDAGTHGGIAVRRPDGMCPAVNGTDQAIRLT